MASAGGNPLPSSRKISICCGKMIHLGFAFNDKDFSDRVLHLEVVGDSVSSESDAEPIAKNLNKKQKTGVLEEKGDGAYNYHSECSTHVEVKTLHINSAILAASSPFFYKLFKNCMRESQQKGVTLKINASASMMDLLNFMYCNTLSATSVPELVDVLIIADKFMVSSCVSYCCELLKKIPMSLESALLYIELSSSVSMGEVTRSLIHDAEEYLVFRYEQFTKLASQEESMSFPLSAIQFLLGVLEVESEEDVYEFILKWGRARYPNQKERQEILTKLVGRVLDFSYMHLSTLREIQDSPDFDSKEVSKLILESLYLNARYPYGVINRHHTNRYHDDLLIKVVESESLPHLVVYLNLGKKEFDSILTKDGKCSQTFFLGGQSFALWVEATIMDKETYLGLFVERLEDDLGDGGFAFDYEFEVMKDENSVEYKSFHKACTCKLSEGGHRLGLENLFGVPWREFLEEYFINEVLHLRVQFTIKNNSQP